jgi:DNA-binding transcriptional LysR family regulator
MNISQIKYVLEVSNSSSIREAATKLFITQPALSSSIRELEEELGILIFERTNKGISLTEDGREFVTYAKKVVSQYEIMEERYFSRDVNKERFSVSTQHYNFSIKAFTNVIKKNNPEKFSFSIHETKTKKVLEDVRNLKSEVGVISFSGANEAIIKKLMKDYGLVFTPLMVRETYIYVWKDHEFAGRKEISIEELADYPCITFDQSDDSNYYLTEEAMADYDFPRHIKSDDRVLSVPVPQFGAVMIYSDSIEDSLSEAISKTVLMKDGSQASPLPELYYVLGAVPGCGEYNKIVASYRDGLLNLGIAQGRSLLLANCFHAPDFTSAEYFIFLALKKLQLNPEVSTICMRSLVGPEEEMSLYRYFKSVEQL